MTINLRCDNWLFGQIGHVRYINILTWLRGFQVKLLYLVLFLLYPSLCWELRDKGNLKNLQFWPESLGTMLEYWYIERGLLGPDHCVFKLSIVILSISSIRPEATMKFRKSIFKCKKSSKYNFYFPKKFIFSLPIIDWSVERFFLTLHVFFNHQRYLERYGYLSPSDVKFGQVKSKWKLYRAVRNLQRFTGLNETGNPADPNTINMVTKQRCGFRDLGKTAQFRRKKRYSLHGTFWRKNVSLPLSLTTELTQASISRNWRKQETFRPLRVKLSWKTARLFFLR